jgi:hypothetical protein
MVPNSTNKNSNELLNKLALSILEIDKVKEKHRESKTREFIISLNTARYILTEKKNAVIRIIVKIIGRMNFLINCILGFLRTDLFSIIGNKIENGYRIIKGYLNAGIAVRNTKKRTVRLIITITQSFLSNDFILDITTMKKRFL